MAVFGVRRMFHVELSNATRTSIGPSITQIFAKSNRLLRGMGVRDV